MSGVSARLLLICQDTRGVDQEDVVENADVGGTQPKEGVRISFLLDFFAWGDPQPRMHVRKSWRPGTSSPSQLSPVRNFAHPDQACCSS